MKNGFIIVAISNDGVEKVKLYHGNDKEALVSILALYGRIMPYLKRLDRLVIAFQKEKDR
jgi:hypothetical protein